MATYPLRAISSGRMFARHSDGTVDEVLSDDSGGAKTTLNTAIAGERNTSSATNSYLDTRSVANAVLLSGTSAVTIGASAAANDRHLQGIMIGTALAGTLTIAGFEDSDAAAASMILPIGTVAGYLDFHDALNSAGALTMTLSAAGDDNDVMVFWRAV